MVEPPISKIFVKLDHFPTFGKEKSSSKLLFSLLNFSPVCQGARIPAWRFRLRQGGQSAPSTHTLAGQSAVQKGGTRQKKAPHKPYLKGRLISYIEKYVYLYIYITKNIEMIYVPWSKVAIFGDDHPTFNRNPYNGYINPYYWVDEFIPYYMEIMGV